MPENNFLDRESLKQQIFEEEIRTLNFRVITLEEKLQFKNDLIDSLKKELLAVNSRAEKLDSSLLQKSDQIDELHNSLVNKQKILDSLQNEILNRSGLLDQLKSKMAGISKSTTVKDDDQIKKLRQDINSYEDGMNDLRAQLNDAKKAFEDKEKMYTKSLEHMTRVIQEKESSLDETVSQLEEKDVLISTLQGELQGNHDDLVKNKDCLQRLGEKFVEKESELTNVRKGLASWIDKVKNQNADLKSKESEIIVLKSQLKTQEREIQYLKAQLREKPVDKQVKPDKRKTPYEILGVTPQSTFDEIKKAHRLAVKKYNPHIVETLGDDVKDLVIETSKEINLAFAWFKKKFGHS